MNVTGNGSQVNFDGPYNNVADTQVNLTYYLLSYRLESHSIVECSCGSVCFQRQSS